MGLKNPLPDPVDLLSKLHNLEPSERRLVADDGLGQVRAPVDTKEKG